MYYYNIPVLSTERTPPENMNNFNAFLTGQLASVVEHTTVNFIRAYKKENIQDCHTINPPVPRDQFRITEKETHYTEFRIPKRDGGFRTIQAPDEGLKRRMREDLKYIQPYVIMHSAAYAYVPGRNIKNAIEKHKQAGYSHFLKLDFHNFFGSCDRAFIKQQLQKVANFASWSEQVMDNFTDYATLQNVLPQGTPLSPFITNAIMIPLDYEISKAVYEHHGCYTRYADDILISTTSANACAHMKRIVLDNLANTPLTLNEEKTRISSINGKNFNLGLMLNKDHNITVGYRKKEQFRARLSQFCLLHNTYSRLETQELAGLLNYYLQIEPDYFRNLLTKYQAKYRIDIEQTIKNIISR